MDSQTGAKLALDVLADEGVEVAFGYPGGAIMPLYDALYSHRIRHVLTRHEAGAAFAASGYARCTGRVGVCMATSGPGATNLVTGIADAMLDNVPMVAITGQVRSTLMGTDAFQEVDIAAIVQGITKYSVVVRRVDDLESALRSAFRIARGPRPGPVLVDIPTDVLRATTSRPVTLTASVAAAHTASADAIAAAVAALRVAERPLIIAGGGARWNDAVDAFRELCATTGAPHVSTLHGLGCAQPGDPNFLGMGGMHGTKHANVAIDRADCIVALGMRFDDRFTGDPKKFAASARTIVHAEIDASEFDKNVHAHVKLHGDVRATLEALNAALHGLTLPNWDTWLHEARGDAEALPTDASLSELSATDALDALVDALPENAIVTTDVGQHQMWAAQRVRPFDQRSFLSSGGLGSMGFGFPAAIGAQVAHPDRTVVCIVGDGGFQMSLPELATLKRHNLPVKIVVIDNRYLGMVRQWQQIFWNERYAETHLPENPDFTAVAAAYGVYAERVDAPGDLKDALERFIAHPGPALLHCACYPHENVWPMIPSGTSVAQMMERVPV